MTFKFIHPTLAQTLRVLSYVIALANILLAYSATIRAQTWVPASLAMYYPVIFGLALVIHQTASTFGLSPDASAISEIRAVALEAAQIAGTVANAKETSEPVPVEVPASMVTPKV